MSSNLNKALQKPSRLEPLAPPATDSEHGEVLTRLDVCNPSPKTMLKLLHRIKALVVQLLPHQVDMDVLRQPEVKSQIINSNTVSTFIDASGDLKDALPFALLKLKQYFQKEALQDQSDYDEHMCRSVASEVLARYVMHRVDAQKLPKVMSHRFLYLESDGDLSAPLSVLELAIDLHATFFLSSDESQTAVTALWNGSWVQIHTDTSQNQIEYVPYHKTDGHSLFHHFDPSKIAVPKYQNYLRIVIWVVFLAVFSFSVQSPTEQLNPKKRFDEWEYVLYGMSISFLFEEANRMFKSLRIRGLSPVFNFWTIVNVITYVILTLSFNLRVAGIYSVDESDKDRLHMLSFEILSMASPLIWIKLLPIFDLFLYVGTMELVIIRMIRQSLVFFLLLGVVFAGHAQALYALDAADGEQGSFASICKILLRSIFGDADFGTVANQARFGQPFGEFIFYAWCFVTIIILLNVLVALYASSYEGVTDDAVNEFMAFFAGKTVSMIRTPDHFVYVAPFNLIEDIFVAPFEWIVTKETYSKINRVVLSVLFLIPLSIIAALEANDVFRQTTVYKNFIDTRIPFMDADVDDLDEEDEEYKICRHRFEDLKKRLETIKMEDDLYQDPYAINNNATTLNTQYTQPIQHSLPPDAADESARKIFIGGLNWDTTEENLSKYFNSVQQVMIRDHWLDGKLIDPKRNMHRHDNLKHKKIFIGGIPLTMPVEQVVDEFGAVFGTITDANLMYDKETGRSRGFGFLTFESEQQAEDAVKEGRFDLVGKSVEVKRVQTRNERSGTQDAGKQYQTSMFGGPTNNPFNPQAMAAMYQRMGWNAFGGMGMMNPMMMGGMGGMANPMMQMMQQNSSSTTAAPSEGANQDEESAYGSYGGPLQPGLGQIIMSDLAQTAYADALINARPGDSVAALQNRIKKAATLQEELANFFQARASAELAYAASLNKITRSKPFISDVQLLSRSGLGGIWDNLQDELFQLSVIHDKFAKKISDQVEKPLRMASQQGEWGSLPSSDTEMNKLVKSIDESQKSVNKFQRKVDNAGGKKSGAAGSRLTQAQSTYANAQQKFISSAPSYFNSYQITDSNRLQELRSIFVKWETMQSELNQSKQKINEHNLAELLNWSTDDDQNEYLTQLSSLLGLNLGANDSLSASTQAHSPNTQSQSFDPVRPLNSRSSSTLKENASGVRSSIANTFFSRNRSKSNSRDSYVATPQEIPPVPAMSSNPRHSSTVGDLEALDHPAAQSTTQLEPVSENLMDANNEDQGTTEKAVDLNGTNATDATDAPEKENPETLMSTSPQPIETSPSTGNDQDDNAAMSKVRQSLIASAPVQRRPTTMRGRRDVRNTMFVNDVPDDMPLGEALKMRGAGPTGATGTSASPTSPTNPFVSANAPATTSPPSLNPKPSIEGIATERTMSMSSTTPSLTPSIQNKSTVDPFEGSDAMVEGLKPAITENVNVLMKGGEVVKVMITGEVSLWYKPSSVSVDTPTFRLSAFEQLEKVAPNPQYLEHIADRHGEYKVNLDALSKVGKALVLKYQLYISQSQLKSYVPMLVNMKWKHEFNTHSAIVNYSLNQESSLMKKGKALNGVQLLIPINAKSVQSKPQGIYSPERKKMTWMLNNINDGNSDKILARFVVDDEQYQQQPAQLKWIFGGEITSDVDVELENIGSVSSTIKNTVNGKYLIS
ncbi:hypothetical protein E3P81_02567 [Wallemia ichthyophaga]|nr:hypothetical protein E3P97_02638 [Wallemia ichthyophaga]TIB31428.1 hypothetical protein E3P85_02291 [Wallemia ichthyophaga]TIB45855.1 hypothetical protein E3P82_02557 [Wallemia ichthyophaga]TIB49422.1 hypothetical protein E3P81_02567 [Wallemia ichthyophaga]TIB52535.1 hypothetical protein E3P80_02568 [Wallemia ichthyophaga]